MSTEKPSRSRRQAKHMAALSLAAAVALLLGACAPPGASTAVPPAGSTEKAERPDLAPDETAAGFDLDALIEAAKKEGPITIYDETGKVVQLAEAFTQEYGIPANGVKIETNITEKVRQEHKSGNVIGDVVANSEVPNIYAELLHEGYLVNWVPGDIYDKLPERALYPYLYLYTTLAWTYNAGVYGDKCPITNIWQLTEPEWEGSVTFPDPESMHRLTTIWNQAAREHAAEWEKAYEEYFGESLRTDQPTAVHEWVVRLAANSPIIFKNEEEVSDAIGAAGQANPPVGLLGPAKYRNNEAKGYSLAFCSGLNPFAGHELTMSIGYAAKSKNPNAAKLYIYFVGTQKAMDILMPDSKFSFSPLVMPVEDPHGILSALQNGEFQPFSTAALMDDSNNTVAWSDLWRGSRR
jgi:iron(III) transport system substrate-binding protein